MAGLLVRVGIDITDGKWNSPVNRDTNEFVYVPVPEDTQDECRLRSGYAQMYNEYTELITALRKIEVALPNHLENRYMHLDPDFEHLTYGDGRRKGSQIMQLSRGDFLAFYAGLKSINPKDHGLVYALIGFFVIDEIVPAEKIPEEHWGKNAHTRREPLPEANEIVVRAQHQYSGRLRRCIPIGGWRNRAYRVCPDILEEWGGLSVNNGYIQRSAVLPAFTKPERFLHWFNRQTPELVKRNNLDGNA
ncbi:MAG: hypothetical protein ABIK39_00385 [candidate division WOR-3 bacterium]